MATFRSSKQDRDENQERDRGANVNKQVAMPGVESRGHRRLSQTPISNVCLKSSGLLLDKAVSSDES